MTGATDRIAALLRWKVGIIPLVGAAAGTGILLRLAS
jgi:hypothetical protein